MSPYLFYKIFKGYKYFADEFTIRTVTHFFGNPILTFMLQSKRSPKCPMLLPLLNCLVVLRLVTVSHTVLILQFHIPFHFFFLIVSNTEGYWLFLGKDF